MEDTVIGNPSCELCDLHISAQYVCLMGRGPIPSKVMLIGEAPGEKEDDTGKPFQGRAGKLLDRLLGNAGLDRGNLYITNSVRCRPPNNKTPSQKQIKACKVYTQMELEQVRPKFVLLMGAAALKAVLNKSGITTIHGTPIVKDQITYFPVFHPSFALRNPSKEGPLQEDLHEFSRIIQGKVNKLPDLNIRVIKSWTDLDECVLDIRSSKEISYDIETTGLDRFAEDAAVNIMGIQTPGTSWVIPMNLKTSWICEQKNKQIEVMEILYAATRGRRRVAHNGKFDDLYTEYLYGIKLGVTFDTMLASHTLDENTPNSLDYLAKTIFGAPSYDIDLETKQGKGNLKKLFKYSGYDIYYTLQLYYHFRDLLKSEESLWKLFDKLVMPVAQSYEVLEKNGVFLDIPKLEESGKFLWDEKKKCELKMNEWYRKFRKRRRSITSPLEVNWNSTSQVGRILFLELDLPPAGYTDSGAPSTAEDFLRRMDNHPLIDILLRHREVSKLHSSFIKGWGKRVKNNSWLHPSYKIHGTVTGRPSCVDPNFQQTPRDPRIRSSVGAPEGWEFFEADYSQVELRIAAMLSGEHVMLEIFRSGGDIHRATAAAALGKAEEDITKEERKAAKAVNFGFLYGMGALKFQDYALDKYGVKLTLGESKTFRKKFFSKYPGLLPWHDKQRRVVHALGRVRTLTGRIRRLPEIYSEERGLVSQAERNAINSPVQGFGAEMILMSLPQLIREVESDDIQFCGTIHDAIVGRVKKDHRHLLVRVKEVMEHPKLLDVFDIQPTVPIIAEVKVGNWGIGEELKV